jgi:hypothetical protein
MRQGRLRRIAAASVFLAVAVGASETQAIGLELAAVTTPGAAEAPSLPKLPSVFTPAAVPQAPSLPKLPTPSAAPGVPTAPSLAQSPLPSRLPSAPAPSSATTQAAGVPSLSFPRSSSIGTGQGPAGITNYTNNATHHATGARLASVRKRELDRARARERRRASARRLRAVLARLEGCFYALSRLERRVLVLRAGLNGRRAHSRSGVARRLNISRRGVRRTERRGLRRLRAAARRDGCATSARASRAELSRLIEPVGVGAALRVPAATLDVPASSDFTRRGEANEPPASLPLPDLDGDGRRAGAGWWVVGVSWAVATLVIMSLFGLNRLLRLRRQK